LQVLDDGHITDAQGRKVDFKNAVIIMTSNVGARNIISPKKLGFTNNEDEKKSYDSMKKNVMDEVKQLFKPEFLNRIDDIIVFHPHTKENIKEIAKHMLKETTDRIKQNLEMTVRVTENALAYIADEGYDQSYGARPLRRAIQTKIEDIFAEQVLDAKFKPNDIVIVDFKEGKIELSISSK
jgi:ATP-dependent Clp protease ATP-binding subunit ClpC